MLGSGSFMSINLEKQALYMHEKQLQAAREVTSLGRQEIFHKFFIPFYDSDEPAF